MNPDAEINDALNAAPAFRPPATFMDAVTAPWKGIDTSMPSQIYDPDKQAFQNMVSGYQRITGRDLWADARTAGYPLDNTATMSEIGAVAGQLANGLPDRQYQQLAPLVDLRGRAAEIAQRDEQARADVQSRTYGLTDHAAAYMSELAHGMTDPLMLVGGLAGGPEVSGILPMLGREFALNAGIGGAAHLATETHREELGLPERSLTADALQAGLFGAGQGLVLRGAGWALGKALGYGREAAPEGFKPAETVDPGLMATASQHEPADFDLAARWQDRQTAMAALSGAQTFGDRIAAERSVDEAATRLEQGPAAGELPAAPSPPSPLPRAGEGGEAGEAAAPVSPAEGASPLPQAGEGGAPAPGEGEAFGPEDITEPPGGFQTPSPKRESEKIWATTLRSFLKGKGGIRDDGGELSHMGLVNGYPGLVNNKRGMHLDRAREAAAEAGYLGSDRTEAMAGTTVDDLLQALREERVYSSLDAGAVDAASQAAERNRWLDDVESHSRAIEMWSARRAEPPIDAELRTHAAELLAEGHVANIDDALERAAIELEPSYDEREQAAHEAAGLREFDVEGTAAHLGSPGDEGARAYYEGFGSGDRPGEAGAPASPQEPVRGGGAGTPENARDRGGEGGGPAGAAMAARTDAGPEGTRQTLIDGVAPISDRDRIAARAEKPMRGGDAPAGGLFDEAGRAQKDIFDPAPARADLERDLAAQEARSGAVEIETPEGKMNARDALREADDFSHAVAELADCIFKFGG